MPSRSRLAPHASRLIRSARVAHLATADAHGQPHVVPICFIFDGKNFYSPIDEKPKRVTASKLKRLRNIRENPQVALVIDRYDENWAQACVHSHNWQSSIIGKRFQTPQGGESPSQKIFAVPENEYRSVADDIDSTDAYDNLGRDVDS